MGKMEQEPLFGDVDEYVNTLETEITLVRLEIDKADKAAEKAGKKSDDPQRRLLKLIAVRDSLMAGSDIAADDGSEPL